MKSITTGEAQHAGLVSGVGGGDGGGAAVLKLLIHS